MEIYIAADGTCQLVYDDRVDLRSLGEVHIRRASHVEPVSVGQWTADMRPVHGPILGPFPTRSQALAAELAWLSSWFEDRQGELIDECSREA